MVSPRRTFWPLTAMILLMRPGISAFRSTLRMASVRPRSTMSRLRCSALSVRTRTCVGSAAAVCVSVAPAVVGAVAGAGPSLAPFICPEITQPAATRAMARASR